MEMKPQKAFLPKQQARRLKETCRRRLPRETCGIVFGTCTGDEVTVNGFAVIRNAALQPEQAFAFEPNEWIQAFYEARRQGRDIVGFFHSHPRGLPTPSIKDVHNGLPWGTCWIVGISEGNSRIAVYRREDENAWIPLALSCI